MARGGPNAWGSRSALGFNDVEMGFCDEEHEHGMSPSPSMLSSAKEIFPRRWDGHAARDD